MAERGGERAGVQEGRFQRPALRGGGPRTVFWTAWIVLSALSGLWAVANPIAAAPDEPTHIIKAAGLVRERTFGVPDGPSYRELDLPWAFGITHEMYPCHVFRANVPASCWPIDYGDPAEMRTTYTTAVGYNPLYYAVVGLPSVLPPSLEVLYLMRLVGAVLGSGLIALGLRSLAEMPRRRWAVAGTAVAVVPMVLFVNSTVNPNALETSAGFGLWLTLLAALRHPDPALVRRQWWRAGLLVVALVNAKAFSPIYLAIIVLTVVALVPWVNVRDALRDRRTWPGLALGVVGSALAVLWTTTAGRTPGLDVVGYPDLRDRWLTLELILRQTTYYYEQLVANFGWHDSRPPDWVYTWISVAVGVLLLLVLVLAGRRERLVVGALAGSVVLLPVIMQLPFAPSVGLPWQGRYLAAVAVGVPLVAGVVLDRADVPPRIAPRLVLLLVGMMAVVQVVSFVANLQRYTVGSAARWFSPTPNAWNPPLPAWLLIGAYVVAVGVAAVLLLRLGRPRAGEPSPARVPAGRPASALGVEEPQQVAPVPRLHQGLRADPEVLVGEEPTPPGDLLR